MNSELPFTHRWMILAIALALVGSGLSLCGQDDEAEARRLYAVGKAALKDNDFEIAARNFERAAALAPRNALLHLSLAIVQNQLGKVSEASDNLKQALAIGLDGDYRNQAEGLQAELDYKSERQRLNRNNQERALAQAVAVIKEHMNGVQFDRGVQMSEGGVSYTRRYGRLYNFSVTNCVAHWEEDFPQTTTSPFGRADGNDYWEITLPLSDVPGSGLEVRQRELAITATGNTIKMHHVDFSGRSTTSNGDTEFLHVATDGDARQLAKAFADAALVCASIPASSSTKPETITYTPHAGSSSTPARALNQPSVKTENGVTTYTPRPIPGPPAPKKDPF